MTITYKKQLGVNNDWVAIEKKVNGVFSGSIPKDKDNTDYQEYLKWTKASPMNVAMETE